VTGLPDWPCLTREIPALGGQIKVRPEDFLVEEIPAYPCSGQGTHTYFGIEKTGMTTLELIRRLARALGRREREFGYAGLKDAHAVTRQVVSIEHVEPQTIEALSLPEVKILWIDRHGNKLKLGHLAGNKFKIKVRDVPDDAMQIAQQCLEILLRRGVPNYFGVQRFGVRRDSWIMGRAIVKQDYKDFVDQFCGRPLPSDKDLVRRAREAYDRGEFELAAEIWPGFFRDARRACRILAGSKPSYHRAAATIDHKLKRLFVSAYQSYLFNDVLAARIDGIDRVVVGDLACKHVNGAVFLVEDEQAENLRTQRFEISPTGPLYGYRMRFPEGDPGRKETELLEREELTPEDFRKPKGHKVKGSRRPLRVQMHNLDVDSGEDEIGRFLLISFQLPPGSYATAVIRELMKEQNAENR